MRIFYCGTLILFILISCNQNKSAEKKLVDIVYIDSIKNLADTSFYKKQYTADFAAATYYGNRKDSVLMQIMKGKDSSIKQVIVTKNNRRIYFAQFYNNGQQKAVYNFDSYGSNDGQSSEFFENGNVKEQGNYKAGFRIGEWKTFDSTGKELSKARYNENGQVDN